MSTALRAPRFEYVIQFTTEIVVQADEWGDAEDLAWHRFKQIVNSGDPANEVTVEMVGKLLNEPDEDSRDRYG